MAKAHFGLHVTPYVAGERRQTEGTIDVFDLSTNERFATVATADEEMATDAVATAADAVPELRETTIPERAAWCEAIADGIRNRSTELAETIVREAGKPISSARGEVTSAAERFDRAAEEIRSQTGEFRAGTTASHADWDAIVKPEPLGVVLCISPYNYPLATTALQVAPALAAGNSVVLKPASKTPVTGSILADIIAATDVPTDAFNYVPGRGSVVGDPLVTHDDVAAIMLTGSSSAGEHVAAQSGMVRLQMELGGNAPAVVFPDADLRAAADACASGGLKYAGQRCSAISRVLVHESIHDRLVNQLDARMDEWTGGDLFDDETSFAPLIDETQVEWVDELVTDARAKGATLVRGGESDGRYYDPTLLADVPHDAKILREEQFGPVVPVTAFESQSEAVSIANATDLALDASVFTDSHERAMTVADAIDAGAVRINGAPSHGLGDIPFGGNGASGTGRQGLHQTITRLTRTKSIVL